MVGLVWFYSLGGRARLKAKKTGDHTFFQAFGFDIHDNHAGVAMGTYDQKLVLKMPGVLRATTTEPFAIRGRTIGTFRVWTEEGIVEARTYTVVRAEQTHAITVAER